MPVSLPVQTSSHVPHVVPSLAFANSPVSGLQGSFERLPFFLGGPHFQQTHCSWFLNDSESTRREL